MQLSPTRDVPNSRSQVSARRAHQFLVGGEDCLVDRVGVTEQGALHLACGHVDESDLAVSAGDDERLAVTTESQTANAGLGVESEKDGRKPKRR
jgi:hypothetical protein